MSKLHAIAFIGLLIALPLTGCVQNMSDLKDKLTKTSTKAPVVAPPSVDPTKAQPPPTKTNLSANQTRREVHAPVARMTVFGDNGALVFRASFVGEDQLEAVEADGGNFTLISTESEALTTGATLVKYEWKVDEKVVSTDKKATVEITAAGQHMIQLTVTDSDGSKDSQMVHLFIAPTPFDVKTSISGGQLAGATDPVAGQPVGPTSEAHKFTIPAEIDGKPVKALSMTIVLSSEQTHDARLVVTTPEKKALAPVDVDSFGGGETLKVEAPAAGDWTITADTSAGVTQAHAISVLVTYVEVIAGGGDGHGHHH